MRSALDNPRVTMHFDLAEDDVFVLSLLFLCDDKVYTYLVILIELRMRCLSLEFFIFFIFLQR